jgi:predicted nucleic acid-binding Zn ribbon protein
MPTYEYRCTCERRKLIVCSSEDPTKTLYDNGQMTCEVCSSTFLRVFSFRAAPVMHSHWNDSVGEEVSSMAGFKDALKRKSDEATERTGIPHDFQPIDWHDPAVAPKSDAGMQSTHDRAVATGQREPSKKIL